MSRCALCGAESPNGHGCSTVPPVPLMVDHQGQGLRVVVTPMPKPEPKGGRVRRKG